MRLVGYRSVWRYLDGDLDLAGLQHEGVVATRRLAKRQLTWFRREADAHWFDSADKNGLAGALDCVHRRLIFNGAGYGLQ